MMDGAAVKEVAELARAGQDVATRVTTIGEHVFSTTPLHHLPRKTEPEPTALAFNSLQALAEYVKANRDGIKLDECVILVGSPTSVSLLGPLTGEKRQRFTYATATCKNLVAGWTGQYHTQEDFVVAMQSRFTSSADRATVLKVISKLKEEQSLESEDDGVGQRATVRAGVVLAMQVEVPNPVRLSPFRTFREVVQPASAFVLRVQKGPRVALFEADGGAWEIEAVDNVGAWLATEITGVPILG